MLRWHNSLYVRNIKSTERVRWKIEHKAGLIDVYAIVLSDNPNALLEIYPSSSLMQSHIRKQDLYIVGLARGYYSALKLVRDIVDDVYRETGSLRLRNYFQRGAKKC